MNRETSESWVRMMSAIVADPNYIIATPEQETAMRAAAGAEREAQAEREQLQSIITLLERSTTLSEAFREGTLRVLRHELEGLR